MMIQHLTLVAQRKYHSVYVIVNYLLNLPISFLVLVTKDTLLCLITREID
jgi:hypothetical protein